MMLRRVATVLLVAMVAACARWEVVERSYASREDVVRAGAIDRGWIPAWIPESARDIREVHNVDTNVSQLAFAYRSFDIAQVGPGCAKATPNGIVLPRHSMAAWWPNELRVGSSQLERFSFFACPQEREPHAYLAVDEGHSKAYFWREWGT